MNNITLTALENKWPLNDFNFLILNVTNPIILCNEMTNMHMAFH